MRRSRPTRTPSPRRRATTASIPPRPWCVCGHATGEAALRTEDVAAELERLRGTVALVLLGGVNYLTGELFDIPAVTAAAHDIGAVVGWDLAHAVGNVPLELGRWGVDWAAWCHYKYVNAGPGGPGGAFVHARHASDASLPRLAGWWGNDPATRFRMEPGFVPRPGAVGWQVSTPPVLAFAPLRASLELFDAVGIGELRERSLRLTGYLESLLDAVVAERRARDPHAARPRAARLPALALRPGRARALDAAARRLRRHRRRPRARRRALRSRAALLQLPRLLARGRGAARAAAGAVSAFATTSYGAHPEQVAELWLPAGDGPASRASC